MALFSIFGTPRHATLRVTAAGPSATFDALLLFDQRRGFRTQIIKGRRTPFEAELPDADVTIVVQPRDRAHPVIAEYEVTAAGKRRVWGRSWQATPVLRRRRGGIICAGLSGDTGPDSDTPPTAVLALDR